MKVEANAKVNFTLEVFGKRADGYHALRSVVMPISLSDTLDIEETDNGEITSDAGYDDDLCVKAARVLRNVRMFECSNARGQDSSQQKDTGGRRIGWRERGCRGGSAGAE